MSGTVKLSPQASTSGSVSEPQLRIMTADDSWTSGSKENIIPGVESQTEYFQPGTETRISWVAKLPNEALAGGTPLTLSLSTDRPQDDLVTLEGPFLISASVDAGGQSQLPAWLPAEATK